MVQRLSLQHLILGLLTIKARGVSGFRSSMDDLNQRDGFLVGGLLNFQNEGDFK
jgi:hypothetical protein